jgi:hypothetical protein
MKKFFVFVVLFFGLATPAFASVRYSHSPTGILISPPVSISVSADDFSDLGLTDWSTFWGVQVLNLGNNNNVISECVPASVLSHTFVLDLPLQDYEAILVGGTDNPQACLPPDNGYGTEIGISLEGQNCGVDETNCPTIFTTNEVSQAYLQTRGVISNANPQVKLTTEISGIYHGELPINYLASDSDSGSGGLKDQPISIFYSDSGELDWQKIYENQPNIGVYNLDTTKIPDGANYRIRIVATDGYDSSNYANSGIFSIDNTSPTFNISISPFPIKEKDTISIKITSSEELKALPELKITKKNGEPKIIPLTGSGKEFSASYYVGRGSGKTIFSVSGEDLAGNIGDKISSGASFLVGLFGPPPPVISFPVDGQTFSDGTFDVLGKSSPNTKIIATLNGGTEFSAESLSDGSFKIGNITLSPSNKGYNTLSIIALNEKGEESQEVVLKLKLNSPPKILSVLFTDKKVLSGQEDISWTSYDANDDKLVFSIEYSNDGGTSWDYFTSGLSENSYKIDTLQLADGPNYLFRVTADDGTEKTSKVLKNVTVKNNLPHISLDISANYFTNVNISELNGKVTGSEQSIASTEYSLDGGGTWQGAIPMDGAFNSFIEKFRIPFSGHLKDGKYDILIRTTDTLGRSVKISRSFTIDTIPPLVELPLLNKAVDNSMDSNSELKELQINFQGKTEPKTKIEFTAENKIYRAVADEKGEFEIKDVTLPLHGSNKISLVATDLAGNVTNISGSVISNNPPQISILNPKEGDYLGGIKEISWKASDSDSDPIVFDIFYRKGQGEWIALAKNLKNLAPESYSYKWDVSNLKEASDYQLKLQATDGITPSETAINISIDNTPPQIEPVSLPQTAFKKLFTLVSKGTANDNFSGIEFIEYSIDGKKWFKGSITEGYLQKNVSYRIEHPFDLKDGEYEFGVRAVDVAGNISEPKFERIIVDTTPPRIGSYTVSIGSLDLLPESGSLQVLGGSKIKLNISVESDTKETFLNVGKQKINLSKDRATGLWAGEISFQNPGKSSMSITASDSLGNTTTKENIGSFNVIPRGKISFIDKNGASQPIKDAEINISVWNEENQAFTRWQAENYNESNPVMSLENGEYELALPAGRYQLLIKKADFERVRTNDFTLSESGFINFDFVMIKRAGLRGFIENILEKLNF